MKTDFLPPKQGRSKRTLDKLMQATFKVLNEHGLEGATIPRVSSTAGVAPASVYRRFSGKEALLRAAFRELLDGSSRNSQSHFNPEFFRGKSLDEAVGGVVHQMVRQYRALPRLLLAFSNYADAPGNEEFKRLSHKIIADNLRVIIEGFKQCPESAANPAFQEKVTLGLLTVMSAIETRALKSSSLWNELLDQPDEQIANDLSDLFLAHVRAHLKAPDRSGDR